MSQSQESDIFQTKPKEEKQWFVMRDKKPVNAKDPAYKRLAAKSFVVFTPMRPRQRLPRSKKKVEERPIFQDLLFVYTHKHLLDHEVQMTPTLQYRYVRGGYMKPMTVNDRDMQIFIKASTEYGSIKFYLPEELNKAQIGDTVKVLNGPLADCTFRVMKSRSRKKKHLIVELPSLLVVTMEVSCDDLEPVKDGETLR